MGASKNPVILGTWANFFLLCDSNFPVHGIGRALCNIIPPEKLLLIDEIHQIPGLVPSTETALLISAGGVLSERRLADIENLLGRFRSMKSIAIIQDSELSLINKLHTCFHGLFTIDVKIEELLRGIDHISKDEVYVHSAIRQGIIESYLTEKKRNRQPSH
jgi:hypothetical protein